MRPPDHLALAALLVEKAAGDEAAIEALLGLEPPLDEIVGFHAQQACEKLLKAVLASHKVTYRYTHIIAGLLDDVADKVEPVPEQLQAAADLTPFAVLHRYEALPHDDDPLDGPGTLALVRDLREWAVRIIARAGDPHRDAT